MQQEEQILNCTMLDTDDGVAGENIVEEVFAMFEESPVDVHMNLNLNDSSVGDEEATHGNDSSWSMDSSTVLRVKTLRLCSPILAAKSPFFYKQSSPHGSP